ncbi:MAG: hypothetical protein LBQ09_12165, partial [Acidobacteriaceae bacterium]|nr:hypothetical protein [Acidobacteriaceae bacterium]
MYARTLRRPMTAVFLVVAFACATASTVAQTPDQEPQHQHNMADMRMDDMHMDEEAMVPSRDGSGTSWLPDETPM